MANKQANRHRLEEADVEQIERRLLAAEPIESIAADYGCHRNTLERRLAAEGCFIEQVEVKIVRRLRRESPRLVGCM